MAIGFFISLEFSAHIDNSLVLKSIDFSYKATYLRSNQEFEEMLQFNLFLSLLNLKNFKQVFNLRSLVCSFSIGFDLIHEKIVFALTKEGQISAHTSVAT